MHYDSNVQSKNSEWLPRIFCSSFSRLIRNGVWMGKEKKLFYVFFQSEWGVLFFLAMLVCIFDYLALSGHLLLVSHWKASLSTPLSLLTNTKATDHIRKKGREKNDTLIIETVCKRPPMKKNILPKFWPHFFALEQKFSHMEVCVHKSWYWKKMLVILWKKTNKQKTFIFEKRTNLWNQNAVSTVAHCVYSLCLRIG